jgi:DsbC/DsbD-like thiol-disulfide interchange protein
MNNMTTRSFITPPALAAIALLVAVQASAQETNLVKASLLADHEAVAPGGTFTVGVRLKIKPHWHVYWINPGESGDPTRVKLTGPAGFTVGPTQDPLPMKIELDGGVTYGYEDDVLLLVPVTVSKDVAPGIEAKIQAEVSWLSCKDTCIEGSAKPTTTVTVGPTAKPENKELFATWRARLPIAKDQPVATAALSAVDQPTGPDGVPASTLTVQWNQPPVKVDWYPVSTPAVAIENVTVQHDGKQTRIQFKPTVYKAEQVPTGRVESVLVFEDAKGQRHGVTLPVAVAKAK